LELVLDSQRVTDIIRIMDCVEFAPSVVQRFIKRHRFSGIRLLEDAYPVITEQIMDGV
jgi:hypothetical protein